MRLFIFGLYLSDSIYSKRLEMGWRVDDETANSCTIVGVIDEYLKHTFELLVEMQGSRVTASIAAITDSGHPQGLVKITLDDDFSLAPQQPTCQAYRVAIEEVLRSSAIPMLLSSSRTSVMMSLTSEPAIDARNLQECLDTVFELENYMKVVQTPKMTTIDCGRWGQYTVSSSVRICFASVDTQPVDHICDSIAELNADLEAHIP